MKNLLMMPTYNQLKRDKDRILNFQNQILSRKTEKKVDSKPVIKIKDNKKILTHRPSCPNPQPIPKSLQSERNINKENNKNLIQGKINLIDQKENKCKNIEYNELEIKIQNNLLKKEYKEPSKLMMKRGRDPIPNEPIKRFNFQNSNSTRDYESTNFSENKEFIIEEKTKKNFLSVEKYPTFKTNLDKQLGEDKYRVFQKTDHLFNKMHSDRNSLDKEFEKLKMLINKSSNARNHLLDIQLNLMAINMSITNKEGGKK